ncbi:MAG: hypothetical protein PW843_23710 [Azospirillaceae bacterium]|nr:hypothetical protein [Azospirillaceae bacterium]
MAGTVIRTTVDKLSDELAPFAGNRRVEVRVIDATEEEEDAHLQALVHARMNDGLPGIPADVVFAEAKARILAKKKAQSR